MTRTSRWFVTVCLAIACVTAGLVHTPPAQAANHTFGKSTVWTPDNWRVKAGRMLRATPPNKRGLVAFEKTGQRSLNAAGKKLAALVQKYVGRAKHGSPVAVKVGSHQALTVTGVGEMDGMAIRYKAYLYQVGNDIVLGIALAPKAAYSGHAAVMGRILTSLR